MRNGYPRNGRGDEVGNTGFSRKILAEVIANSTAATEPLSRTHRANSEGMLMSRSAVAHRTVPPANDGTLATSPAVVPERRRLSAMAKTRKPAATQSLPLRKNLIARSA